MTEARRDFTPPAGIRRPITITPDMEERRLRYNIDDALSDFRPWQMMTTLAMTMTIIAMTCFFVSIIIMSVTSWNSPPAGADLPVTFMGGMFAMFIFGGITLGLIPKTFKFRKDVVTSRRTYHDYLADRELKSASQSD